MTEARAAKAVHTQGSQSIFTHFRSNNLGQCCACVTHSARFVVLASSARRSCQGGARNTGTYQVLTAESSCTECGNYRMVIYHQINRFADLQCFMGP